MIEFRIRTWDADGHYVSDAMVGPHSLRMEMDHLPVGWRIEVTRTARPEDPPAPGVKPEDYQGE